MGAKDVSARCSMITMSKVPQKSFNLPPLVVIVGR